MAELTNKQLLKSMNKKRKYSLKIALLYTVRFIRVSALMYQISNMYLKEYLIMKVTIKDGRGNSNTKKR